MECRTRAPYSELLKQFLRSQFVQPDEDGRLRGQEKFKARMLDSIADMKLLMDAEACGGGNPSRAEKWFRERRSIPLSDAVRDPFNIERIDPLTEGSEVARRLYASRVLSEQGFVELMEGNGVGAAQCYAAAYRLDDLPVQWVGAIVGPAIEMFHGVANSLESASIRADALFVLFFLHNCCTKDAEAALQSIKMAQHLAPLDAALYFAEGNLLNSFDRPDEATTALEKAIELGYGCEALFVLGCVLQTKLESEQADRKNDATLRSSARACLEEYIQRAAPEERKVCEAYYHLAMLEILEGNLGTARRRFDSGMSAEARRLSCFEDKPSYYRRLVHTQVQRFYACGNGECPKLGLEKCSGCKAIRYCSRKCQKTHWKHHKSDCHKVKD